MDAERGPAAAGVGRPGREATAATRRAGSATSVGCSSSARLRSASSPAPRTRLRSASTTRSACAGSAPTGACSSEQVHTVWDGAARFSEGGRSGHPRARADPGRRRGDVPRLRRRRLDLPLARAARARLRRLRAARRPRPARRGVGRGRRVLPRRARRRGRRRARREDRGRVARDPLLVRDRPAARDGPHGVRPGRDRPLPHRRQRRARARSTGAAPTASSVRCSTAGATTPRPTASPRASTSAETRPTRTRSAG